MKAPYCGQASATEQLLSDDPSEDELARQRLERENIELRDQVRHLQSALEIAGRVLQPYFYRLNGSRE